MYIFIYKKSHNKDTSYIDKPFLGFFFKFAFRYIAFSNIRRVCQYCFIKRCTILLIIVIRPKCQYFLPFSKLLIIFIRFFYFRKRLCNSLNLFFVIQVFNCCLLSLFIQLYYLSSKPKPICINTNRIIKFHNDVTNEWKLIVYLIIYSLILKILRFYVYFPGNIV